MNGIIFHDYLLSFLIDCTSHIREYAYITVGHRQRESRGSVGVENVVTLLVTGFPLKLLSKIVIVFFIPLGSFEENFPDFLLYVRLWESEEIWKCWSITSI